MFSNFVFFKIEIMLLSFELTIFFFKNLYRVLVNLFFPFQFVRGNF